MKIYHYKNHIFPGYLLQKFSNKVTFHFEQIFLLRYWYLYLYLTHISALGFPVAMFSQVSDCLSRGDCLALKPSRVLREFHEKLKWLEIHCSLLVLFDLCLCSSFKNVYCAEEICLSSIISSSISFHCQQDFHLI